MKKYLTKNKKRLLQPITYTLLPRGFTIFFAMLVGSLTLSIGFAIYDLTVREIDLSAAASQSQYAIYAADTGAECALYWDSKYGGLGSAFATTSPASVSVTSGVACNGQDVAARGTPPATFVLPDGTWGGWTLTGDSSNATTTFTLAIPNNSTPAAVYCAVVDVGKATQSGILYTTILSKGYNNCSTSGAARLERTLRISY